MKLKLLNNFIGMDVGDINRCGWADTEVLIRSSLKGAVGIKVRPGLKSAALFQNVTFEGLLSLETVGGFLETLVSTTISFHLWHFTLRIVFTMFD